MINSADFPTEIIGFGLHNEVTIAQSPKENRKTNDGDLNPAIKVFGPQKKNTNKNATKRIEISIHALEPLSGFSGFPPGIHLVKASPMSVNRSTP